MENTEDSSIVLFSGYAKLPTGITASEISNVVGITVLIDINNGDIVNADCTLATDLARKHVAGALVGHNLSDGPDQLIKIISQIYQGNAKKALITAIRIIYDKYSIYKNDSTLSIAE